MSLKPGYIEVFVFDNGTGDIVNSNGFNYRDLTEMVEQMEEPEQFEEMKSFVYCFKPEYCTPQEDQMGRIEVPGYWEFKEDDYTKEKNKKYEKQFKEYEKLQNKIDGHPEEIEFKF